MPVAVAPVSLTASETVAKTGRSRCVEPAFLGLVPPTTLVPVNIVRQNRVSIVDCTGSKGALTIVNGLLCVETAVGARG